MSVYHLGWDSYFESSTQQSKKCRVCLTNLSSQLRSPIFQTPFWFCRYVDRPWHRAMLIIRQKMVNTDDLLEESSLRKMLCVLIANKYQEPDVHLTSQQAVPAKVTEDWTE